VGFSGQPPRPAVSHRSGNSWSLQRAARPGPWDARLTGVSCPSRPNCTAVGSYSSASGQTVTLVERER
jgi:hypothetical protein